MRKNTFLIYTALIVTLMIAHMVFGSPKAMNVYDVIAWIKGL